MIAIAVEKVIQEKYQQEKIKVVKAGKGKMVAIRKSNMVNSIRKRILYESEKKQFKFSNY